MPQVEYENSLRCSSRHSPSPAKYSWSSLSGESPKKRDNTPDVQSKVDVAPPMKLLNKRSYQKPEREVQLPLNTIAGPSGIILRSDQSAQSRCINKRPRGEATETGFFSQGGRHFECAIRGGSVFFDGLFKQEDRFSSRFRNRIRVSSGIIHFGTVGYFWHWETVWHTRSQFKSRSLKPASAKCH